MYAWRMRPLPVVALAFVLAAPPLASAAAVSIEHTALACAPPDRYVRVTAQAPGAAAVRLEFRSDPEGPWYSTPMASAGGEWSAFLPRAARSLARLEYRVVTVAAGAEEQASPATAVAVAAGCAVAGEASVLSPIVVTVPAGAPVVPPVPAGFSPAGVVAAEEEPRSNLPLKVAGAVVAAGVAAVALGGAAEATSSPPTTEVPVPPIRFNSTDPPPGSTVRARDGVVVLMRLGFQPSLALEFNWRVEFRSESAGAACLFMSGLAFPLGNIDFELSSALISTGACGRFDGPIDVDRLRVSISVLHRQVYEETLAMPFHFRP